MKQHDEVNLCARARIIRQVFNEYIENEMFIFTEAQVGVIAIGKYDFIPINSGTKLRINQMVTYQFNGRITHTMLHNAIE